MTNGNNNDDDEPHRDLTRIEDLSEFLHEEDSELENIFGEFNNKKIDNTSTNAVDGLSLNDISDAPEPDLPPELPPELPEESSDDITENNLFGESDSFTDQDSSFDFRTETNDLTIETTDNNDNDFSLSIDEEPLSDNFEISELEQEPKEQSKFEEETLPQIDHLADIEIPQVSHEKFEEVKNFAQNFSYGQIQGGGNPPFSIIIRNLKYESDAEDIISLMREFGIVTDQNMPETKKALEIGSLLIPQISEYNAITLTHKLRRFDCDLEVGLSDEVHPSKSGETNPRGLMKKNSLQQNKSEHFKKDAQNTPVGEIIVSTTATIEGHVVQKYIGVQTSFAIIDEEELERLKFVQKSARMNSELQSYETDDHVTSERAFKDYQRSFELLFTDLCDQLKARAMKENANALLGLNYQLTSLPFEKSAQGSSCFQLTCSATLAIVSQIS